jgi:hypothetical protein
MHDTETKQPNVAGLALIKNISVALTQKVHDIHYELIKDGA